MHSIGKLTGVRKNLDTNSKYKFEITLLTDNVDNLSTNECVVDIVEPDSHRSLNANAYFHLLNNKLADALGVSKAYMKNTLLGKYGQRAVDFTQGVFKIRVSEKIDMLGRPDIHSVIVGYENVNGEWFIDYELIQPSHTYTKKQMKALIDGTVQDAKEQGIETLTPDELARMCKEWE